MRSGWCIYVHPNGEGIEWNADGSDLFSDRSDQQADSERKVADGQCFRWEPLLTRLSRGSAWAPAIRRETAKVRSIIVRYAMRRVTSREIVRMTLMARRWRREEPRLRWGWCKDLSYKRRRSNHRPKTNGVFISSRYASPRSTTERSSRWWTS